MTLTKVDNTKEGIFHFLRKQSIFAKRAFPSSPLIKIRVRLKDCLKGSKGRVSNIKEKVLVLLSEQGECEPPRLLSFVLYYQLVTHLNTSAVPCLFT